MDTLKKIFPRAFKTDSIGALVVNIIVFVVIGAIASAVIWLATAIGGWIPFLGDLIAWLLGIVGSLVGLYVFVAIVLSVLNFLKIVK